MTPFTVWVDADSCPLVVRNHVATFSRKHAIPVSFVANHALPLAVRAPLVTMQVCTQEAQAADNYIFSHVQPHDAVITRDIPFAARLVERSIVVMNDRGTLFTTENIGERLSERNFSLNLAELGLTNGGKKSYSQKEFKRFADCFEREMQKLLIIAKYGEPRHIL